MLEVEDLHVRDDRELAAVRGVSLKVRGGEIVALAGVDGNGQRELVEAIAGLRAPRRATIASRGRRSPAAASRATCDAGVGHIAEDRQRRGLVLDFTLAENLALREYRAPPLSRAGWLNRGEMQSRARAAAAGVRRARRRARHARRRSLSGGNQQKVCIAREIAEQPEAADRPPADARPRRRRDRVRAPAAAWPSATGGAAILLVSLELEEVRSLADRILVIYEGRIVGEFPPDASEEELGFAMTGGKGRAAA